MIYKIWSSALDGCDCSLCAKLEGTALPADDSFVVAGGSVQAPPLHEGCRCAVMYKDDRDLAPAPIRDLEAFRAFAAVANESVLFSASVNAYHASVFFLRRLSEYPDAELVAAGLSASAFLKDKYRELVANQDGVINGAILRAYKREVQDAAVLKTERGRKARLDLLLQLILSSQYLSPVNYEYLQKVFNREVPA
jgi:hypothetical protein